MSFKLGDVAPGLRFLASPCVAKVAHPSKADADRAMDKQKTRVDDIDRSLLNTYKCMHCGQWHVGRRPQQMEA